MDSHDGHHMTLEKNACFRGWIASFLITDAHFLSCSAAVGSSKKSMFSSSISVLACFGLTSNRLRWSSFILLPSLIRCLFPAPRSLRHRNNPRPLEDPDNTFVLKGNGASSFLPDHKHGEVTQLATRAMMIKDVSGPHLELGVHGLESINNATKMMQISNSSLIFGCRNSPPRIWSQL